MSVPYTTTKATIQSMQPCAAVAGNGWMDWFFYCMGCLLGILAIVIGGLQ